MAPPRRRIVATRFATSRRRFSTRARAATAIFLTSSPLVAQSLDLKYAGEKERIACKSNELGVPWMRVARHLEGFFEIGEAGGAEALAAGLALAAQAYRAIRNDPAVSRNGLNLFNVTSNSAAAGAWPAHVDCQVGAAALRLLYCLVAQDAQAAESTCDATALNVDVLAALGSSSDSSDLVVRVRGIWPIHSLLALSVDSFRASLHGTQEGFIAKWASGEGEVAEWTRATGEVFVRAARGQQSILAQEEIDAVTATLSAAAAAAACLNPGVGPGSYCPYRPPLDAALCDFSPDSQAIFWAALPGKCLNIRKGGTENRNVVEIWDCVQGGSHPNQRFIVPASGSGQIQWAAYPKKCLDVRAGSRESGTALQIFDCTGEHPNQQFLVSPGLEGPIRWAKHPDMCLDVRNGESANGNGVQLYACATSWHRNQNFVAPFPRKAPGAARARASDPLAAATALAVVAARAPASPPGAPHDGQVAEAAVGCEGLLQLCGAASGQGKLRGDSRGTDLWLEAGEAFGAAFVGVPSHPSHRGFGHPALLRLAVSPWPAAQVLAAAAARHHQVRADVAPRRPPVKRGAVCECDLRSWAPHEAKGLAAAMRVLAALSTASLEAEFSERGARVQEVAISRDAEVACSHQWSEDRVGHSVSMSSGIWGVVAFDGPEAVADGPENHSVAASLVERLAAAGHDEWDAGVCLPGAASLNLVCGTRNLALKQYTWDGLMSESIAFGLLRALSGCTESRGVNGVGDAPDFQRHFAEDWGALAPWVTSPVTFFIMMHRPIIKSNLWFPGATGVGGGRLRTPGSSRTDDIASACSGIWNADARHPCHQSATASKADVSQNGEPATRVFGVGPMKAGSTLVLQVLAAATQLSLGFDCQHISVQFKAARHEVGMDEFLRDCHQELFRFGLAKDPMATNLAHRLYLAWPGLSGDGRSLAMYFVTRKPLDCVRSLLQHLELRTRSESAEAQSFSWGRGRFPAHFTLGKQAYLDVAPDGLRYSGYADAALQRWAMTADVYLACPERFALVRYEDFVREPVVQAQRLLAHLNLTHLWLPGAAERVEKVAGFQYQTSSGRGVKVDFTEVFGPRLLARMVVAVASRAQLLGYGHPVANATKVEVSDAGEPWAPIDMPPLPGRAC